MVSREGDTAIDHVQFRDLPDFLRPGDLVVINTSSTRNAAVDALRQDGTPVVVHLSTRVPSGSWVVEIRQPVGNATVPFTTAEIGDVYKLPKDGQVRLLWPYSPPSNGSVRLWVAALTPPLLGAGGPSGSLDDYLAVHGRPIRYKYVEQDWPSEYYQTVYADEMGSAEMPSAGRGFTTDVLDRLRAKGIEIAPLILHTGVASLESHEAPYEEHYRVPQSTADAINAAHRRGSRVIAVGTTVVRALETVTDTEGITYAGEGWTDIIIAPTDPIAMSRSTSPSLSPPTGWRSRGEGSGIRSVDGLITGLHEPEATHLLMLLSMASPNHLRRAYRAALDNGYLWHEFGDLHLILR